MEIEPISTYELRRQKTTDLSGSVRAAELRRIVRVLRILRSIAEEPGTWNRADLAAAHQVSERTITKDLAVLRSVGLAIVAAAPSGGYRLAGEIDGRLLAAAARAHPPTTREPALDER